MPLIAFQKHIASPIAHYSRKFKKKHSGILTRTLLFPKGWQSGAILNKQISIFTKMVWVIALMTAIASQAVADCTCSGSGNCYDITDDESFGAVPWVNLAAGDTVRIHYRSEPYRKIIGLRSVGTDSQPIKVCGLKGPGGKLPTISGENATPIDGYLYNWGTDPGENIGDYGVILVGRTGIFGDDWQHKAKHIIIEGLKIVGAHASNTYVPSGENPRNYVFGAAGVRVTNGENITIRDCEITGNGNGIFLRGDDNGGEASITRNTLAEGNYVHGNGNVGRVTEHNIYSQGVDPVFQYNRIGRQRAGAGGSSLKDRSSGTVVRYNWIETNARILDLVEAEDASLVVAEPSYGNAYVYGNILINEIDETDNYQSAANMVHFGADNMADDSNGACLAAEGVCRNGTLFFYNNTVIIKDYRNIAQNSLWVQDRIFEISIADANVEIRNNIFHLFAPNGSPNLTLMRNHGTANLNGTNWITSGWVEHIFETQWSHWTGTVNYNGTLIEGTDPEFSRITYISGDLSMDDYTPGEASPVLNQASALAPQVISNGYLLNEMYRLHQYSVPRAISGLAMDLGAFEFGIGVEGPVSSTIWGCYMSAILSAANEGKR